MMFSISQKILLAAIVIYLTNSRTAFAQAGTVSWDNGYPKSIKAPNEMDDGAVEVLGSYTVNQGYTLMSAIFQYKLVSGGTLTGDILDTNNGKMGLLVNNLIVAKQIELPQGTYEGELICMYSTPNQQQVFIASVTKTFTISH